MRHTNESISPDKLRKTLFLYSASVFLVFSLAMILTITVPIYNRLKEAENTKVLHDAEIRAMAVNEWSRRVKDLAFQVTSRTRIRQELEKFNNGQIPLNQLQSFTEPKLSDAMTLSTEIIGIIRLDKQGKPVAQCGENFSFQDSSSNDTKPFEIFLSKPFRQNSHCMVIVKAPIMNRAKAYVGADLVLIDLCYLKKIVNNQSKSKNGHRIFLGYVFGNDVSILFHNETENKKVDNNKDIINSLLIKACNGQSGMDTQSFDHVAAYHSLDIDNWGLIILQNKRGLYRTVNTRFIYLGILGVIGYLGILAGFWILMNPLANRVLLHTDELKKKIKDKTKYLEEEIKERKRAENFLAATIEKLERTNKKVKVLTGLVPICSYCKKIRDDKGFWNHLESYIQEHSEASFSHGMCPECSDKFYGDQDWYIEMKKKKGSE